uniref:pre-toxin TG domain-containing protein n=2 Tax=Vibrio TaxID=662 RepID=UPI001C4D2669
TDFTLIEALELTMDFVPVVSNLKAAYEFSTGETIFGGIELEALDRNLAGASIFLGPVAKAAIKTTKVAVTVARHSDEAADLLTASSKVHDATKATDAALGGVTKRLGNFADESKLVSHFEKHGAEFGAKNADEYLSMARNVMQDGTKVQYAYKGETRTGFVQLMGTNRKGQAKFAFVGTNGQGQITTLHTKSGKDFWKTLNGNAKDKVIRPVE